MNSLELNYYFLVALGGCAPLKTVKREFSEFFNILRGIIVASTVILLMIIPNILYIKNSNIFDAIASFLSLATSISAAACQLCLLIERKKIANLIKEIQHFIKKSENKLKNISISIFVIQ